MYQACAHERLVVWDQQVVKATLRAFVVKGTHSLICWTKTALEWSKHNNPENHSVTTKVYMDDCSFHSVLETPSKSQCQSAPGVPMAVKFGALVLLPVQGAAARCV